jgi:hypothetical protein
VLDALYEEAKGTLTVKKGRNRFLEAKLTCVTDPSDKRLELLTFFLSEAKNNQNAGRGA